jgi:nicotinate-nucleotide adenylyltransferase
MTDIGIMGGAFNPIHTRHLVVAQRAKDQFRLAKVIFVPSGMPPHKKADLLDKELRFEMVAAAVADNPDFEPSRIEIDRPGTSWTIDTLNELKKLYGPDARLNFIMGEDNIHTLKMYDRRAEFIGLCRLLVSPRGSVDPQLVQNWRQNLPEADLEAIDCPANGVSSTLIRSWIRDGMSVRYLVPSAVHQILESKGHYKPAPQPPLPAPVAPLQDTAPAPSTAATEAVKTSKS